jgi:GMP synthase PP-ATPase subunit
VAKNQLRMKVHETLKIPQVKIENQGQMRRKLQGEKAKQKVRDLGREEFLLVFGFNKHQLRNRILRLTQGTLLIVQSLAKIIRF